MCEMYKEKVWIELLLRAEIGGTVLWFFTSKGGGCVPGWRSVCLSVRKYVGEGGGGGRLAACLCEPTTRAYKQGKPSTAGNIAWPIAYISGSGGVWRASCLGHEPARNET